MSSDHPSQNDVHGGNGEKKNPLVQRIRCGSVGLSIFENISQQNNEPALYYTVDISRSYRDREGNWKSTSSFYKSQLPQLIYVCQRALEFLEEVESESLAPPF